MGGKGEDVRRRKIGEEMERDGKRLWGVMLKALSSMCLLTSSLGLS